MLTAWILYHIFCFLSTMNFIFLKFFLIVWFLKTIICDSSVIIPLGVMLVNHKFQIFWNILFVGLNMIISPVATKERLRTSHFPCGQCEGRRSQSSEARTPSLALPPRWAREPALHLRCVTGWLLSVCCDIGCDSLCRSVCCIYIHTSQIYRTGRKRPLPSSRMKRQPGGDGIGPGCCGGGVITTWSAGGGVIAAESAVWAAGEFWLCRNAFSRLTEA